MDWDDVVDLIQTSDIDEQRRNRFIKSITVLKKELGSDWLNDKNHPLVWRLQNMAGSPSGWLIPALTDNIVTLKAIPDIQTTIHRIKNAKECEGALAEIAVGSMLARNGYTIATNIKCGNKNPDFHCKKLDVAFLVEIKTLKMSRMLQRADRTLIRILRACLPASPTGIMFKPLSEPHLEATEQKLQNVVEHLTIESPQEVHIERVLKFYLVHPDDSDRIKKQETWHREQVKLGILPSDSQLLGPYKGTSNVSRVRTKIIQAQREKQIPTNEMGVLFILGIFEIHNKNVESFVDEIIEEVYELINIPAIVLTTARITILSQEVTSISETENYININYCPASYAREQVLIIKNKFCRFSFDYRILVNLYIKNGQNVVTH